MSSRAQQLADSLSAVLGPAARRLTVALGEVTLVVGFIYEWKKGALDWE